MTETGMIASNSVDLAGRKAKSVGYPLPGIEICVMTADGKDVAPGKIGEVWLRGDNVFKGYWEMPEKTRESFQTAGLKLETLVTRITGWQTALFGRPK